MAPKRQMTVDAVVIDATGAPLGTVANPLVTSSTAGGDSVTVAAPLGRKADALSVSTALSTEDVALLAALLTTTDFDTKIGSLTEAAPATDTASGGLNGRLQRIAQRITSLIALFPTALGGTTSAASFPVVLSSDGPFATQTGSVTETAPATDTASSGLNGRLQRIAQNITTLIGSVLQVVGSSLTVTPTHTVDTAVYAAGDTVGTIITILNAFRASGKEAILQSIHIMDRSNQKPTGNLLFFNASPAAATTTDNAAFVYSTDDFKEVARVPITASDYVTINSKAVANLSSLGRQVYATTGTSLFVVFVTDGAPDFVATTDLQISYSFLRD